MKFSPRSSLIGKLALLSALLSACGAQLAPPAAPSQAEPTQIMTLRLGAGVTEASLRASYPGSRVLEYQPSEGFAILAVTDAQAHFRAQAVSVVAVEPNVTIQTDTADAQGSNAWADGKNVWADGYNAWADGASSMSLTTFSQNSAAWSKLELGYGQALVPELGKGVTVAVIDTGLDLSHPAFAGKLNSASAWDYIGNDNNAQDEMASSGNNKSYGHGTAVAGIVLQVAPNATILPMRVLAPDGSGSLANVIQAINDSVKAGAKVINLSLGSNLNLTSLNTAISSAIKNGVTVVAAAGNKGTQGLNYPAQTSADVVTSLGGGLISVGSVDLNLKKSSFSCYGWALSLTAPGEGVVTSYPNRQRVAATGTSFSVPIVAGAVALAYSAGINSPSRVQSDLQVSATPNTDSALNALLGKGTVDVGRFLHRYR